MRRGIRSGAGVKVKGEDFSMTELELA